MKGKVIKYFSFRGFGFINPEGSSEEIFFHVSNYPEFVQPEIGNELEFEINETPKGKEAIKIRLQSETSVSESKVDVETESEPEVEDSETSSTEIGDLKGVGKVTEEKLKAAGYDTVESLVSEEAETVSEKTGISTKVAAKLIVSAKELLG